jgi:AraC-like DNA-binding protein
MHSHTFRRRLDASATSFHELVDECRFEMAREMLLNTSLSVSEISASMGYSRASSFIRAFRRWSGLTPGEWRKGN